jgi:hypothetical protein
MAKSILTLLQKKGNVQASPEPPTTQPASVTMNQETPDSNNDHAPSPSPPPLHIPLGTPPLGMPGSACYPAPPPSPSAGLDSLSAFAPFQLGHGPTLNGFAVPLVDGDFNDSFVDDGDKFMKIDCWLFKALSGTKRPMGARGFRKTNLGTLIRSKFRSALGRHTRTAWFVDSERQPVSTISVDIDGVTFEFLPKSRAFAAKYSEDALSKLAELAQRDIAGTLPKCEVSNHPMVYQQIRNVAATALDATDLETLAASDIKWVPSRLRFWSKDRQLNVIVSRRMQRKCKGDMTKLAPRVVQLVRKSMHSMLDKNGAPPVSSESSASKSKSTSDDSNSVES